MSYQITPEVDARLLSFDINCESKVRRIVNNVVKYTDFRLKNLALKLSVKLINLGLAGNGIDEDEYSEREVATYLYYLKQQNANLISNSYMNIIDDDDEPENERLAQSLYLNLKDLIDIENIKQTQKVVFKCVNRFLHISDNENDFETSINLLCYPIEDFINSQEEGISEEEKEKRGIASGVIVDLILKFRKNYRKDLLECVKKTILTEYDDSEDDDFYSSEEDIF